MKVAVNVLGSAKEPRMQVHHEQILVSSDEARWIEYLRRLRIVR